MPEWDELFQWKKYMWKDPHPSVVSLVDRLRERDFSRTLDLGCGAGRHMAYLSKLGFPVFGIDPALNGLLHSARWLRSEGFPCRLGKADMTAIPARTGSFDCVISIYVLHHNTIGKIRRAVKDIERVLKPGGLLLILIQSKDDWKFGRGRMVEKDTFIPDIGDEKGVLHHFFDKDEIMDLLKGFSILKIKPEKIDSQVPEGDIQHRHWDILAEKSG